MSAASIAATAKANHGGEAGFVGLRSGLRTVSVIPALARRFWPEKTAPKLASRAQVSVRQAQSQIAGSLPSYETMVRLLHDEEVGFPLLEAIMESRGRPPLWWRRLKRTHELGELRRQIEREREEIAVLERKYADLDPPPRG